MFLMIVAHGTDVSGIYGGHTEAVEAIERPLMPLRGCCKANGSVTTISQLCFELEQIRDHFSHQIGGS